MFVVLVTIVLLIGMRHLFRNLKGWLIDKDNLRQAHFAATIYRILKAAVVIAAVLMILQLGGIDITHIVVGLGVLVAVITLAMKDAFQDGLADAGLHIQYTQFVVREK